MEYSDGIKQLRDVIISKRKLIKINRMLLEVLDVIAHGNDYESSMRAIDALKEAEEMK